MNDRFDLASMMAGGRAPGASPLQGPIGKFALAFLKLTTTNCSCDVCRLTREGLSELEQQLSADLTPAPSTPAPAGE